MEHKENKFEISCNDVLLLRYETGEDIGYTCTDNPNEKGPYYHTRKGNTIQNQKIELLVLTKNKNNIFQYTSALNGHKIYATKDKYGNIIFLKPNKNRFYKVRTCRLTTPINEKGWFASSKQDFLMTARDNFERLVFVYTTPTVLNGYELFNPDEEKVIDKLLMSQHITANDLVQAKEIITKFNTETARRYKLLLKNVSMLEQKEKLAKKQKAKAENLERKTQLKVDRQKLKTISNCVKKIAEK